MWKYKHFIFWFILCGMLSGCSRQSENIEETVEKIAVEFTKSIDTEADRFVLFVYGSGHKTEDLISGFAGYCERSSLALEVVLVDESGFDRAKSHGLEWFPSGVLFVDDNKTTFESHDELFSLIEDNTSM